MFVLLVEVEVRPEHLEAFRMAVQENARHSVERDRGCLRFDVHQIEGSPTRFVYYEVYDSEAAWEAHRLAPHFLRYTAVADRALIARTLTRLQPLFMAPAS